MHLLAPSSGGGGLDESLRAIDLGISPADVVFLTTADSEIGCMVSAFKRHCAETEKAGAEKTISLRCVNVLRLKHPFSVDMFVENTLEKGSQCVIMRLLGGVSYWRYGCSQISQWAKERSRVFIPLPGEDQPDNFLAQHAILTEKTGNLADWHRYFIEGGVENFLQLMRRLHDLLLPEISGAPRPEPPKPLPRAGLFETKSFGEREVSARRALIVFYRAWLQSGQTEALRELTHTLCERNFLVRSVFISSNRDATSRRTLRNLVVEWRPDIILDMTGFAGSVMPLVSDCPVLQTVPASCTREQWRDNLGGLPSGDIAMYVALPEIDGRVPTRSFAFKSEPKIDPQTETALVFPEADKDRCAFIADLSTRLARLRHLPKSECKFAFILGNSPNRDSRIANGVGLDVPESLAKLWRALALAGYAVHSSDAGSACGSDSLAERAALAAPDIPNMSSGASIIAHILQGPTNQQIQNREVRDYLDGEFYKTRIFGLLPESLRETVLARWGVPEKDPFWQQGKFALAVFHSGNMIVGLQPARGYGIDLEACYHDPDLVPPHYYIGFYGWLRECAKIDAVIHFGKHGTLEWLPGKSLALSSLCWPEAVLGSVPHFYPFIVNDPGEGTQARRRSQSVIIDHLMPPLTQAGIYGSAAKLELALDEYYAASQMDSRRLPALRQHIAELARHTGLARDCGLGPEANFESDEELARMDNYLCALKELQIRGGLHVFGESPKGKERLDTILALLRVPRGNTAETDSILRALAKDLALDFDPLESDSLSDEWRGERPEILKTLSDSPWRSKGDTLERLELLAMQLLQIAENGSENSSGNNGKTDKPVPSFALDEYPKTRQVIEKARQSLIFSLDTSGAHEHKGLIAGLSGRFVLPGPSGAPSRGRPECLPTGRNFYSLDTRAVPTRTAWRLGRRSAELLVEDFVQRKGHWPRSVALSAWGTSCMRTGGDDIAQLLALVGLRPVWEENSGRVTDCEIVSLGELGRPRVSVTLKISGFFRDAFPGVIAYLSRGLRKIAEIEESSESSEQNPIAADWRARKARALAEGMSEQTATAKAGLWIFGAKPGSYGAGLQGLIDSGNWKEDADLARAFLAWGGYAYGTEDTKQGSNESEALKEQLRQTQIVIQNQDNREHDLLDSDDYYQFEGGLAATIRSLTGETPDIYHNDHSRPESPRVQLLGEEIARIVRGRAANPKWISAMQRHGYKGAFEMLATLDYLFGFAVTTRCVASHHFEQLYDAWLGDDATRQFIADSNPDALKDMVARFEEALRRGVWKTKRNDIPPSLAQWARGEEAQRDAE